MDNYFPDDEYQSMLTFSTVLVEQEKLHELVRIALHEISPDQAEMLRVLPSSDPGEVHKIGQVLIAEPHYVPAAIVITVKSYLNAESKERPVSWYAETELRHVLLIEAESHGLGVYYRSIYPNPHFIEQLRVAYVIPTGYLPMTVLFLGYPDRSQAGSLQRFEAKVKRDKDSADHWSAGL
jgi:nitroreductase